MKAIVALLLGVAAAWNQEYTMEEFRAMDTLVTFEAWAGAFGKTYPTIEEAAHRYIVWLDNLFVIAEVNSQELTYKLALNQFSDLNTEEFRTYVHGDHGSCFRGGEQRMIVVGEDQEEPEVAAPLADSVDWTTKGVVTPVKNQGQCGSCWAFSATGAIECQYAIKNGKLNSLAEQQLVDCAGILYGCMGCNGGQMTGAMRYSAANGGLCSESAYKYTAKNGQCKATSCGTKYDANKGVQAITTKSESALKTATAAGCVSIGIEADQTAFQHYSSGVLTGTCGTSIDHGVLVVGYGTSGSSDYWKVKNSWGASWGMNGYILICRNCNKNGNSGECGILMEPNIPTF